MAPTTKSNSLTQSNGHLPLRIRIYRPSDWEELKPIFIAGVRAPLSGAVGHMYTWPRFYPVYALVGGGVAWLGRQVWNVAHQLGLQAFRVDPWSWVRLVGRRAIESWTWKESAALGSIALGLVTWGMTRWMVNQLFHGYAQMSLETDLKDIPEHYRLERVELKGQGEQEEWRAKGTSAFWVAEIGDEVVGCIGLGESFINIQYSQLAPPAFALR